MLARTTETFLSSATSSWNHPHKKRHFVDGERQKEIVELAKPLKNECRLSKRRARNRKRANERHEWLFASKTNTHIQRRMEVKKYVGFSLKLLRSRVMA